MSAGEIKARGSEIEGVSERTQGGGNDCMTKQKLEEPPPSYQVSPLTEALHSPEQSQSHRSNPFEHVSLL